MNYRYIATFEADSDVCFTPEVQEKLKNRIKEDIELQCGYNVSITLEDARCIEINDNPDKKIISTIDTMRLPDVKNKYIAYAKLLINNLKQLQVSENDTLSSDFDEAMIAAVNLLLKEATNEEKEENGNEKEQ